LAAGLLLVALLDSCAVPTLPQVIPPTPVIDVQPGTWRAVEEKIFAASVHARHEAAAYARVSMDEWRVRVRQRIGQDFIPWYSGYWTQQWIAARVAWYQLAYTEGEVTPEERLVSYLQEQFTSRVLEPVSDFVDPRHVMEEATAGYVRELKTRLEPLAFEYRIPVAVFNAYLDTIPAIVVQALPLQDATLLEVLQATQLSEVPAYGSLLAQIEAINGTAGPAASQDRLNAVARRAVTRLVGTLAVRGGATAASTLVGGFWGVLISAGSAAWGVVEHDNDNPALQAQLRENLEAALDLMWQELVEDEEAGVTAAVHHLSTQIEHAVSHPPEAPLTPYLLEPSGLF